MQEYYGTAPIARDAHTMVASKSSLYLFGGHDGVNHLNDLHEFNTLNNTWTEIKYEDKLPNGLRGHSANCIGNNLYIFGGYDGKNKSNELICFNLAKKTWYQPAEIAGQKCLNFMNGRQRHSTNTFGQNKIVIFGGFDGKTMLNDVYMIDISILEDSILSNQFSKSYVKNLRTKVFNKPEFSDLTILVKGDKKIYAHRAILAAQCEKFRLLFTSEMQDSKERVMKIETYSYESVLAFLEYIYCGEFNIDQCSTDFLFELLQISDEYIMEDLSTICYKKLKSKVTPANVCDILIAADQMSLKELKTQCKRPFMQAWK